MLFLFQSSEKLNGVGKSAGRISTSSPPVRYMVQSHRCALPDEKIFNRSLSLITIILSNFYVAPQT